MEARVDEAPDPGNGSSPALRGLRQPEFLSEALVLPLGGLPKDAGDVGPDVSGDILPIMGELVDLQRRLSCPFPVLEIETIHAPSNVDRRFQGGVETAETGQTENRFMNERSPN